MKTLRQIKDEVALEYDWVDWTCFKSDVDRYEMDVVINEVSKRYAKEVAKEALKNAVNHLDVDDFEYLHKYGKCFKNILSETNIPKEVRS